MSISVADLLSDDFSKTLATTIDERNSQELIIAMVGPVGSGVTMSARLLHDLLTVDYGYNVPPPIKPSEIIRNEAFRVGASNIPSSPLSAYVDHMQTAGNKLREKFGADYLAQKTVEQIVKFRRDNGGIVDGKAMPGRRAYIIDSVKNVEELALLRRVYRETLCVVGVFAPDEIRKQRMLDGGADVNDVKKVIDRDQGEAGTFGQMTRKVFSLSDFFVCNDAKPEGLRTKLSRYLEIIFDVGVHTPTRFEAAMDKATMAGAGSACMSRQVGAAIISSSGELIATGCNDVPKFGGGLYTEDDQSVWDGKDIRDKDNRCFKWGGCVCHNEINRNNILEGIIKKIGSSSLLKKGKSLNDVRSALASTDVDDLIEYSRSIHAEMEAILSVAREGKHSLVGSTLFTTTYPCHNCARHIVAAGVREVVYIHPYRKSKAIALHHDAITEDPNEEGKVFFRQYDGVAPQHFFRSFQSNRDRKAKGEIVKKDKMQATPIFKIPLDAQLNYEDKVIADLSDREHSNSH